MTSDLFPEGFGFGEEPELTEYEQAWLPRLSPWAEPTAPLAARESPLIPTSGCPGDCLAGECGGSPWPGCGGCCRCLGGCQALYEQAQTAPHVWTGDPA